VCVCVRTCACNVRACACVYVRACVCVCNEAELRSALRNRSLCSGQGSRGMSGMSPEDAGSVRSTLSLSLYFSLSVMITDPAIVIYCMCGSTRAQNKRKS